MKKRLLRACAGVLAAMMLMETAFAGNLSARVYADELDQVQEEVLDEASVDEGVALSETEEVEVVEEVTAAEQSLDGTIGSMPVVSVYFDTNGGILATDQARLIDARYDADKDSGLSIREAIEEQVEFASGETVESVFVPVRTGYDFEGWVDDDGNDFDFDQPFTSTVTAHAVWTAKKDLGVNISVVGDPEKVHDYDLIKIETGEPGATVYYTIGSSASDLYTSEVSFENLLGHKVMSSTPVTVSAVAIKEGCEVASASLTVVVEPDWGDITDIERVVRFGNDRSRVPEGLWVDGVIEENKYIAKPITFEDVVVHWGTKLLEVDKDYLVEYQNNVNAYEYPEGHKSFNKDKAPAIVITGRLKYVGTYKDYFVINKVDISDIDDKDLIFDDMSAVYNGTAQKLIPGIRYLNKYLKNGTDFKVGYPGTGSTSDYIKKGEYPVKVVGSGNYKGTKILTERICSYSVNDINIEGDWSLTYDPYYEDGDPRYWRHDDMGIKLQVWTKQATKLVEGRDYELVYVTNPPKVGTTALKLIGLGTDGGYAGTKYIEYKIKEAQDSSMFNIANCYFEDFSEEYVYDGLPCDQSGDIKVYIAKNQTKLEINKDYKVELKDPTANNVDVGEVTIVIRGIGERFYGKKEFTFNIVPRPITKSTEIIATNEAELVNGIAKNEVKITFADKVLEEDKDYTLTYTNNSHTMTIDEMLKHEESEVPTVTIKGIGNYKGSIKKHFAIIGDNFDTVRVAPYDKAYVAKADNYTTGVLVTDANGNVLTAGKDYLKEYKYYYVDETLLENGEVREAGSEIKAGDMVPYGSYIRMEITPQGSYAREIGRTSQDIPIYKTVSGYFRLAGLNIAKTNVTILQQFYTGHEIVLDKSQIQISYGSKILSEYDYEIVEYKNNIKPGTAEVTLRGVGDYYNTVTVPFTIGRAGLGAIIRFLPNAVVTSGVMSSQTVTTYGTVKEPAKLVLNKFKRDYYEFVCWNTKPDGTGIDVPLKTNLADIADLIETGVALNLYAVWKPIDYKITVYKNGGDFDETLIPAKYNADTVIPDLPVPDISTWPKGYMFAGWYTDNTYKTRISSIDKGSHGDLTLFAKWVAYTYTIKYDSNWPTGTCTTKMAPTCISYGETKALSINKFTCPGYVFEGWSLNPDAYYPSFKNGQKVSDSDLDMKGVNNINAETTLYAVWRKVYYVYLDVDADDAEISEEEFEYTYGTSHSLATPVREGYTFGGWFTAKDYKTKVASIPKTAATDYYLFAKWTPNTYSVVFNKNATKNISGTMSAITCTYDVEKALPANKFIRKGYEFIGWNTAADGSGEDFDNLEVIENLAAKKGAKVTLYAQWTETGYTIEYHDNGGIRTTAGPSGYYFGDVMDLPTITKAGYVFGGWYKEPEFKNKVGKISATMYGDLNLYAKWTSDKNNYPGREYTIKISADQPDFEWDGTVVDGRTYEPGDEFTYKYGSAFTLPNGSEAPERYGYNFAGWFTTPTYSKKITGITAKTYDDITLYAKWTPKTYSVTYKISVPSDADTKIATVTGKDVTVKNLKYEVSTALRKNTFKIKGYTFKGWAFEPDATVEDVEYNDMDKIQGYKDGSEWLCQDETLYAVWEKDEYSLTYHNVSGIYIGGNPNSYQIDDEITFYEPQCVGKTFVGWYLDAGFTKKITTLKKGTTGDKNLYAKWTSVIYDIKYVKNDDGDENTRILSGLLGYVTNYFKRVDGGYVLPAAERRGYKFLGWSLDAKGKDPVYVLKAKPTADIIYYAAWEAEVYNITYDYCFDDKVKTGTYSISKKDQNLMIPSRYGYEFVGWHIGEKDGPLLDIYDCYIPAQYIGDIKLYAEWSNITYTIKFDMNGAPETYAPASITVYDANIVTLPPAMLWNGKKIVAWQTSTGKKFTPGQRVSASDLHVFTDGMTVTLKAVWE